MGHRHLELSEQFGAYFLTSETHPTACLTLMGGNPQHIFSYKKRKNNTLTQLATWVSGRWFGGRHIPQNDGQLDALVCAMVAAALGGNRFAGLQLVTPVLANKDARTKCRLNNPELATPSESVLGTSPFYLLATAAMAMHFNNDGPPPA